MSKIIPKPLWFVASFLLAFALYWPSMNGTPIWDDLTFWFADPVMKPDGTSYIKIWLNFAWPFSVSLQKLMLTLFQKKYFYYHIISFCIHFANSFLVYKLSRILKFKYSFLVFLLFLLHPACVITTAWMIQLKTLLSFFFALASILAFLKGNKDIRWMIVSWLCFALSITSKSSSITLPLILLVISFRLYRFQKMILLIPFFLLSAASGYRVLTSKVTIEGSEKAVYVSKVSVDEKKPEIKIEEPAKRELKPGPAPQEPAEVKPSPETVTRKDADKKEPGWLKKTFSNINGSLILQTLNYYFWHTLIPLNNTPVRGLNTEKAGMTEFIHLFFLGTLVIVLLKDVSFVFLAATHFLLIPFIGLVPAPFMNITWVSDQHLYLALPTMLFFWMKMIEKLKWKYAFIIPLLLVGYFSYKTFEASKFYKNETVFYEQCIKQNPLNVPIAYNLAINYLLHNDFPKAYHLLSDTISLSKIEPSMSKSLYFPYIVQLFMQLQGTMNEN